MSDNELRPAPAWAGLLVDLAILLLVVPALAWVSHGLLLDDVGLAGFALAIFLHFCWLAGRAASGRLAHGRRRGAPA